jgi:hypothetical protein
MAKKSQKIPTSAREAKKMGYESAAVKHSGSQKRRWAMLKQRGRWEFVEAASAKVAGSHTICLYNPQTGFYDDCFTVEG